MIQCSHCGTQNREGSKFCSDCGARFAPQSGLICPMCSTPNKVEDVFCAKCGARLVPLIVAKIEDKPPSAPPIKGLSLPAKPMTNTSPTPPAKETPPANEPPSQSPDWMERLRSVAPVEEEIVPAEPTAPSPAPADESSSWLARLRSVSAEEPEPTEDKSNAPKSIEPHTELPFSATTTKDETPSWLARLEGASVTEEAVSPSVSESASGEDLPAWLKAAEEPSAPHVATPRLTDQVLAEPSQPVVEPEETTFAEPQDLDRLQKIEMETEPPRPTTPVEETHFAEPLIESLEASTSAALAAIPEVPAWVTESPSEEALAEEDIPDWLRTSETPTVSPKVTAGSKSAAAPAIQPALPEEVPAWVVALKPSAGIEQEVVESSGPLEGLRGVLPLAMAIVEPHQSVKLAAVAKPNEHARLFDTILAAPAGEATTPSAKKKPRALTMRPLIYLLLALAVLIPFGLPFDWLGLSLPISNTPATELFDTLKALNANSTVLIAFDYEPGLAGEMDLLANALVRDLSSRGVKIVAVSTHEAGPRIAARALNQATSTAKNYTYGESYLNWGYLAGAEAGLKNLATAGFAAKMEDWNGKSFQSYPLGKNLRTLRDVSLVIVLAGSDDALELWIKQVQPSGVKMAAGVSAAVTPKAQAFRESNQLVAFASGLISAAQYEVLSNPSQMGLAQVRVNAQSVAQIALVLIIVLGNIVYWLSRARGKAV